MPKHRPCDGKSYLTPLRLNLGKQELKSIFTSPRKHRYYFYEVINKKSRPFQKQHPNLSRQDKATVGITV